MPRRPVTHHEKRKVYLSKHKKTTYDVFKQIHENSIGHDSWAGSTARSPTPGVVAFIGFAAQAEHARFESAGTPSQA